VISFNACLAEVELVDAWDRGVKNLLNFLGVIEGLRRSFLPSRPYVGGGRCGENDDCGFDSGIS
jgi:hypothetical protein